MTNGFASKIKKQTLNEEEDLEQVKDQVEDSTEGTQESELSIQTLIDNINVLIADEEAAIEGYNGYIKQAESTISDTKLLNELKYQLDEIISDEQEHIEKLKVIQEGLK